jgi:hypothetical protein
MNTRETIEKYRTKQLQAAGFKCIQAIHMEMPDGTTGILRADCYLQDEYLPDDTEQEKRAHRIYTFTLPNGTIELMDELELEGRLGTPGFNALT